MNSRFENILEQIEGMYSDKVLLPEKELSDFLASHKNIYVYGAGNYASGLIHYFEQIGVCIKGIIAENCKIPELSQYGLFSVPDGWKILSRHQNSSLIVAIKPVSQDELINNNSEIFRRLEGRVLFLNQADLSYFLFRDRNVDTLASYVEEAIRKNPPSLQLNFDTWKSILVLDLEYCLGDTIWGTPVLRNLRKNFPHANITYVINQKFSSLFSQCPYADNIIEYGLSDGPRSFSSNLLSEVRAFCQTRLSKQYDTCILLRATPYSGEDVLENVLISLEVDTSVRIAHSLYVTENERAFSKMWEGAFSRWTFNSTAEHEVSRNLSSLRACGLKVDEGEMELWPSDDDLKCEEKALNYDDGKLYISVGIAGREERRSWPFEKYLSVFQYAYERYGETVIFVLLGGEKDITRIENYDLPDNVINLVGKTSLNQSVALMQLCHIYLGSDTGTMHMAAAMKEYIIELTANLKDGLPTDQGAPERTGPWMVPNAVIRPRKSLDGCKRVCLKPYCHCIREIAEEDVEAELSKAIDFVSVEKGSQ